MTRYHYPHFLHPLAPLSLAIMALTASATAHAQSSNSQTTQAANTAAEATLPTVDITSSTRTERPISITPASVSLIDGQSMREGKAQINLTESLGSVPGLQAQNRNNYAQDLQLSIRGFGSRSTFGVRGLRIYVDGIPATMPDGQTQTSNIDIASIDHVEVLRGPFSSIYGNSSGGVIQIFTAPGDGKPQISGTVSAGSDHTFRYGLQSSGATGLANGAAGVTDYNVSANRFTTRGYRDQSAARKNLANARLGIRLTDDSKLTLVANSVDLTAQDPLGLKPEEYNKDWHSTTAYATKYNTRKTVKQTQAGLTYEKSVNADNDLRFMLYYGTRDVTQYQAIPPTAASQRANGGVIDFSRDYGGMDLRWTSRLSLAGQPLTLVGGLSYDLMKDDRKGYNNYLGDASSPSALGIKGALKRDEDNRLTNLDPYLQATWNFAPRWSLDAGLRYSHIRFKSSDHFITADNDDNSGEKSFNKWLPVASLGYQLRPDTFVYASAGRGFETPTFTEISYRPDGGSGLNFGLKPSSSNNYEVGAKVKAMGGLFTAALFQVDTSDEIVSAGSIGGRSTFRNLGKTRRTGTELSWNTQVAPNTTAQIAYTWIDAKVRPAWRTDDTGPRIPGVAKQSLYASIGWIPTTGWRTGADWRYLDKVYANSENTTHAPSYAVAGLWVGYKLNWRQWDWTATARVDNVFDRHYVGSVIVNDTSDRYFEPATGRNWMFSLNGSYHF